MAPIEWYYARGAQQFGPVASAELKQLAAAGKLRPEDLIWREGMAEWVAAGSVKGLFEGVSPAGVPPKPGEPAADIARPAARPAAAPGPRGPTARDVPGRPMRHLFDVLLDVVRAQFTPRFIDSTAEIFAACGHYGLYAAMLLSFGFSMILGIKSGQPGPVLLGILSLLALAVLQYVARRFCESLERLNRTTRGTVASTTFPDCFALLNMVSGVTAVLAAAVMAIRSGDYPLILVGLVAFIVCEYLAFVALNPSALSISVVPQTRAGEEAIGVLSFLLKAVLRLVPVAFGAGVVYGTLMLLYACYRVFGDGGESAAQETATTATLGIACFAALPFVAYLVFLLYYLSVDVIGAVLSVPGKLDQLAAKDREQ